MQKINKGDRPSCLSVHSGLRELRVTGLSWSCLSALVSPTLPCLRLLDLRWCDGIRDAQIKEMVCPPGGSRLFVKVLSHLEIEVVKLVRLVLAIQLQLPSLNRFYLCVLTSFK